MSLETTISEIIKILVDAGYRSINTPLVIGGLKFEFPAILIGTETSPDLILIADNSIEMEERIVSKLAGVARALDVARSRRPITAVIAGPRPSPANLEAMSRVSRVLMTSTMLQDSSENSIRNNLAVLLPLQLPNSDAQNPEVSDLLPKLVQGLDQEIAELVITARHGSKAVQAHLHSIIEIPFNDFKEGNEA